MAQNFLEQLVAEWYEYQGYFVRRNINVGRRAAGGYECELDIIAFDPKSRKVIHIEPSMDAQSWAQRTERYKKKFRAGQRYIPMLFEGLDIVGPIEQIALFVFASNKVKQTISGGKVMLVPELLQQIFAKVKGQTIAKAAVPEQFPLIRTLQMVSDYRDILFEGNNTFVATNFSSEATSSG